MKFNKAESIKNKNRESKRLGSLFNLYYYITLNNQPIYGKYFCSISS